MLTVKTRHLCSYYADIEPLQHDCGYGHFGRRMIAAVVGGAFEGERLKGKVLNGGGDWATIEEPRGTLRLDARLTWETEDGAKIYVSYRGVLRDRPILHQIRARGGSKTAEDYAQVYFRTAPLFETGDPRYQWLNDIVTIGMGGATPDGIKYEVFEVL